MSITPLLIVKVNEHLPPGDLTRIRETIAEGIKKGVYITFNYDTVPINYGDDEPEHERVSIQVGKNPLYQL